MQASYVALLLTVGLFNIACDGGRKEGAHAVTGGDPDRGAAWVTKYGCGSCHTIPGIRGAQGRVGPALSGLESRIYVAGKLPNQPGNLIRWIENPHAIDDRTAMPNLGVTHTAARDIAAYLYSIK